jgi:hypothetical protein
MGNPSQKRTRNPPPNSLWKIGPDEKAKIGMLESTLLRTELLISRTLSANFARHKIQLKREPNAPACYRPPAAADIGR